MHITRQLRKEVQYAYSFLEGQKDKFDSKFEESNSEFFTDDALYVKSVLDDNNVIHELHHDEDDINIIIYDTGTKKLETGSKHLFGTLFSMIPVFNYNPENREVKIITSKEFYHSTYGNMILEGNLGVLKVVTENWKQTVNLVPGHIEKADRLNEQRTIIERMVDYREEAGFEKMSRYEFEKLFNGSSKSAREIAKIQRDIFYIEMARRITGKELVLFKAFVVAYEQLDYKCAVEHECSEKDSNKWKWYEKGLYEIQANMALVRMKKELETLIDIAIDQRIRSVR